MKKLFTFLTLCLLALSAPASIVDFWMTNWIAGGGPLTNGLKITQVGPPVANGVYLQIGRPTWIYPDVVTGKATTNFNVGVYQIEVYGFVFQQPIYMPVPNDTARYNATDLITNGVASATGMGASSVSQIIAGAGIGVSPANGLGNVTVNLAERVPVGNAPTNTLLYTTNIVVMTRGEDFNHFVIVGAGTSFVNGTNYTVKTPLVGNIVVYTNDTGTAGVLEDPDGDVFWSLTNSAGLELYNGNGPGQQWTRTGGLNPVPSSSLSGYGFSTNYSTQLFSVPYDLPQGITQTNILYVRTSGNDYSAVRGRPDRPWRHVFRAMTNAVYDFDGLDIGPGFFEESTEWTKDYQLPINFWAKGAGRGITRIHGLNNQSKWDLTSSNRIEHMTTDAIWYYTGASIPQANTNVVLYDLEASAIGDVVVFFTGGVTWDPYIIDCQLSGSSDKIADLSGVTVAALMASSHFYIINTTVSGGPGADGKGMNFGLAGSTGVPVYVGVTSFITGNTNTYFTGLNSQVSTSGTFTATGPGFIGPGPGITALNAGNASSGTLPAGRLPAFTGDVTSSAGSAATTIANNAVTLPKIVNASATQRAMGRNTAGSGNWEEVSATQLLDWIGSTRGSLLSRGASGWAILTPGTSGTFLQSSGSGADPLYAAPSGFTIPIITIASASPSGSTTYYFGADSLSSVQTTYANVSMKIPRAGTIKGAFFKWSITTPGSGESVPFSIRINDTTDVSIQSVTLNAARVDVYNSSMSQAVSKDDTFVLKMVTPAWVSAPATMRGEGYLYIE